ncbi:TetR/AcrR family transcriptional regulator [Leifsonia sp. A12D58]|uniref:TetR/AcrR family transcriptional regulator n=1 Tax=Leifsonia sp. A12D58 TaxID=3397674 RepID=UPI0039E01D15
MAAGRKRSESSRLAALDATRSLLLELGYERLTLDAIAARAGVGRQTLYRWWGAKGAIVAEAALDDGVIPALGPVSDTGDVVRDVRDWMRLWVDHVTTPVGTSLTLALAAAAADDQAVADQLFEHFTGPHEQLLKDRLEQAAAAGHLRAEADVDTLASVLIGFMVYRVLGRQQLPTARDVDALVDLVIAAR